MPSVTNPRAHAASQVTSGALLELRTTTGPMNSGVKCHYCPKIRASRQWGGWVAENPAAGSWRGRGPGCRGRHPAWHTHPWSLVLWLEFLHRRAWECLDSLYVVTTHLGPTHQGLCLIVSEFYIHWNLLFRPTKSQPICLHSHSCCQFPGCLFKEGTGHPEEESTTHLSRS